MANGIQNARNFFSDMRIDFEPRKDIRVMFSQVLNDGDSIDGGAVQMMIENPIAEGILMRAARTRIAVQNVQDVLS
jgi:hypothetical protein